MDAHPHQWQFHHPPQLRRAKYPHRREILRYALDPRNSPSIIRTFHGEHFSHYLELKLNRHPEGRVVCAPKDLNLNYAQDFCVEILRLSLSDSLRMTRRGQRFYFGSRQDD